VHPGSHPVEVDEARRRARDVARVRGVVQRIDALDDLREQRADLEKYIATAPTECYANGQVLTDVPSFEHNTDLRPRDEYFVNNGPARFLIKC